MTDTDEATFAELPRSARAVAEAIGLAGAMRLFQTLGGQRVYIPKSGEPPAAIVATVGQGAAELACGALGLGRNAEIPNCRRVGIGRRNAQMRADRAAGASISALAKRHGLGSRRVRFIVNGK